jgi:hypothetical protein
VTQQQAFELFVQVMEQLQVPYMICGSVAAMAYGEPRLTKDLDVVVALLPSKISQFTEAFAQAGFYCPPVESIQEEFQRRGMFNLLHMESDTKIDCIFLGVDDYDVEEFRRRRRVAFTEQMEAMMARPEDIIIGKLQYYRMGQSEKHMVDIRGMIAVSGGEIDFEYIDRWAGELGLMDIWNKLRPSTPPAR